MTNKESNILADKLDTLIRLVSVAICQDRTQKEQISLLNSAGIGPKVIAEILDTTPNNVSVTLSGEVIRNILSAAATTGFSSS